MASWGKVEEDVAGGTFGALKWFIFGFLFLFVFFSSVGFVRSV